MAIFTGRYSWDGTKYDQLEPVSWYPGAYDLKIFGQKRKAGKIEDLKPFICLYSRTGEGQSISANPERFARRICHDFALEIERVLWVEDLLQEHARYEVVQFVRQGSMGDHVFYRVEKRQARPAEIQRIEVELKKLQAQKRGGDDQAGGAAA